MHMKSTVVVAAALCLAIAPAATAQTPVTKTKSVSATATIQAIDSTTRTITLRDAAGVEDTYVAGPEIQRFAELKVGDTVKMTYYESVFLQVRKAGGAAEPERAAAATPTRQLPGARAPCPASPQRCRRR